MKLPCSLRGLRIPVVGAPLFLISGPDLVLAQCKAGVVGSFPALNAPTSSALRHWLSEITQELAAYDAAHPGRPAAPFAVNQIAHKSNVRLQCDVEICQEFKVPIVITSLGAQPWLNDAIHSYGGFVFHDVTTLTHAKKALDKGADGLVAVCAGAGGHGGALSPFALVQEIRDIFDGPLALSGSIASGRAILAAQAMGADLAYIGSAFIATMEARASAGYKQMIVDGKAEDIVCSESFTGVRGNYLRGSISAAGLDPDHLPAFDPTAINFGPGNDRIKPWRDIWGSGHGIGAIDDVVPAARLIDRFDREYRGARQELIEPRHAAVRRRAS